MRRALALLLTLGAAACALTRGPEPDGRLEAWQGSAQTLRGLELREPVKLVWISPDDVPGVIRAELEGALTPERAARTRDGYAALGLLPPDFDLTAALLEVQAQAIAGLYSPRRRTLFVLDEVGDSDAASLVVVHELVRALQHQHFRETVELMTSLRRQDDVTAAISAMLEGDATLTMLGTSPHGRGPQGALAMRDAMLAELARPSDSMAALPPLLRASLIFPYAHGTVLAAERYGAAGNAGLDAALRDPPLSSARVLHPDDTDPVEFVRLPVDALAARLAPRACAAGADNVVGALTLAVLFTPSLEPAEHEALARAWRGDRYVQLSCGATWELVWLTRWDSAADAERFARSYRTLAPAIGANSPLSGAPEVIVRERSALVVTPGAKSQADWLLSASEVRAYADFAAWRADGCFPESPCPH